MAPCGVTTWCAAIGPADTLEAVRAWRPDVVYAHRLIDSRVLAGLDLDGAREQRGRIPLPCPVRKLAPAQQEVISRPVRRRLSICRLRRRSGHAAFERSHDRGNHLVLDRKYIGRLAVVAIRP